jgi:hypothetical protein
MGARWYDSALGRWTQPDTLIPDQYNPDDWDRFQFVRSNPLKYSDPSGHKPCFLWCENEEIDPEEAEFETVEDRQDFLFSLIFKGSGFNGEWTLDDWTYYYAHRDNLWSGKVNWIHQEKSGWSTFAAHARRLASYYGSGRKDQFVRDFGLVFGGISSDGSWTSAAWEARGGPKLPFLHEGNNGLSSLHVDSKRPGENQSHHYAGMFVLSYFAEPEAGVIINLIRDPDNPGDINLGNAAASDAYFFRYNTSDITSLASMILSLSQ